MSQVRAGGSRPGFRELMLRESNEFHGNDFSGATLDDVSFRGIDLTQQRLPTGDDYLYLPDAAAAIERALAALAAQPPDEHHTKVERFLREVLGREVAFGQRQLLLREKDFGPRAANPDVPIAFKLLREAA